MKRSFLTGQQFKENCQLGASDPPWLFENFHFIFKSRKAANVKRLSCIRLVFLPAVIISGKTQAKSQIIAWVLCLLRLKFVHCRPEVSSKKAVEQSVDLLFLEMDTHLDAQEGDAGKKYKQGYPVFTIDMPGS